ncbi:MAG: hypothetical protein ABEH66_06190 [Halobacteriales archaeon]
MAEERTRIDFNAPTPLVERADALADVLGTSRTRILVDALRDELDELAREDSVRREVREAFYDGRIAFETLEWALGTEEARRVSLLRESLDREPPDPQLEAAPDDEEFYDGDPPEWTPDDPEWTPDEDEDADDDAGSAT